MDVFQAFEYVFEDTKWFRKVIVGGIVTLLSFVVIGLPLLAGYDTETLGNLINGRADPLPSWSSWRRLFVRGLGALAIVVLYAAPIIVVTSFSMALTFGSEDIAQIETFRTIAAIFYIVYGLVGLVVFMHLGWARYAATGRFSAAFEFGEIWSLAGSRLVPLVRVLVWLFLVQIIAAFGLLLAGIGYPFMFFWGRLVQAHMLAQFIRGEEGITLGETGRAGRRAATVA